MAILKIAFVGTHGVGKTTLIQKIVEQIRSVSMAGFLTAEIRPRERRLGFELLGLNGERRTLSHVDIHSRHRVGKYGVDRDGFETFLETLDLLNPDVELIVLDEIGNMELLSDRFSRLVRDVLASDKKVLASIPLKDSSFIREIKQRPDIHLFAVTPNNRDHLPDSLIE